MRSFSWTVTSKYSSCTRKNAFITELETSARTESKRMTNHNTPQLSRMDLANHCAAFPGLSLLNIRAVSCRCATTHQSVASAPPTHKKWRELSPLSRVRVYFKNNRMCLFSPLYQWYSTFFDHVPLDVISLQLCIPKVVCV
jgi:hypothetical protein